MEITHYPVLIIGGGIVGLTASLVLSHHNIKHLLIERHTSTSIHPRARGINTRAMEIMRCLGLEDAIVEAGAALSPSMGILTGTNFREAIEKRKRKDVNPGQEKVVRMPFAGLVDGVSPTRGARCTQDCMEPVLLDAARERGGEVRFDTESISFTQDSNGVVATILDRKTNTTSTVTADYLIAADGAGSPIRKSLGIGTTGRGVLGNLLNILFRADLGPLVKGREMSICSIHNPELGIHGGLTSINNTDIWVFHLAWFPEKGEKASDYPPERCIEILRKAIGIEDLEIEIKSILPWKPSDAAAEKMNVGRVFLAGDAAHQVTPYCGQGATTGISDVWDLGWKLACVLKKHAGEELLSSYEVERLPVARFVAKESGALADEYGLADTRNGVKTWLWKMLLRIPMVTGFGYRYTEGAIISEEATSWWWSCWNIPWSVPSIGLGINGQPGTRIPHAWVQLKGNKMSTLDLVGKKFLLIAGEGGDGWVQAARHVAKEIDLEIDAYRAGPTGDLVDERRMWEYAAGIGSRGALLIRPDGFVAWRTTDQEGDLEERLEVTLRTILCR